MRKEFRDDNEPERIVVRIVSRFHLPAGLRVSALGIRNAGGLTESPARPRPALLEIGEVDVPHPVLGAVDFVVAGVCVWNIAR